MEIETVYSPSSGEGAITATSLVEASIEGDRNSRFPCIEQPTRVALHCNGYYIWSKKSGKTVCKKKRSENDEFSLIYDKDENVVLQHHKYKGILTVVSTILEDGTIERSIRCIRHDEDNEPKRSKAHEFAEEKKEEPEDSPTAPSVDREEEDEEDDLAAVDTSRIQEADQKWIFLRGATDSTNGNAVMLRSLSTGLTLGISDDGKLTLSELLDPNVDISTIQWSVECVTGELCYLSNPASNSQVRCDMTGLINMDSNQKGWEIFRFMEAGNGYVKISSWMHSQWLLCSTEDGKVSTCTHAESFKDYRPPNDEDKNAADDERPSMKGYRCSKWAIEKNPNGDGVIIRSKTHGRLLCIKDNFELRTYHPDDEKEETSSNGESEEEEEEAKIAPVDSCKSSGKTSFKESMKTLKDSMRTSMRSGIDDARKSIALKGRQPTMSEAETTVWHLEAAHAQTYFFLSLNMQEPEAKAKSIGPKLQVTSNLRKNTKIQLIREDNNITKLCVDKQFLACEEDGTISLVSNGACLGTEWIIGKSTLQEGFTTFYNKTHGMYLSKREDTEKTPSKTEKLNSLLGKNKDVTEVLHGSGTLCIAATWRLDPVMPRAVSSEKVKAFAIGTGIAVGTTVAMPFALAGVAGIMGAIGAEVGTFTTFIFAGLTAAEGIASVGAIGATAFIIFKPEENSLTDNHNLEEEEKAKAWSQRPFSNWRNWS